MSEPWGDCTDRDRCERNAWMETAAQYSRNADYYRDLVGKIGEMFGEVAKTQDDGGKVDNVLCAKVPELVRAKLARLSACEAALARWVKIADSGNWRDAAGLSISAHIVTDDTRELLALTKEPDNV